MAVGVECSSAREGTLMVVYCPLDEDHTVYVRDQAEHEERYEIVNTDHLPDAGQMV